jgi:hypothetical protein
MLGNERGPSVEARLQANCFSPAGKPWIIFAAGGALLVAVGVVLGLLVGNVSIGAGHLASSTSELSLIILLVQACVAAFGFLSRYLSKQCSWAQLGVEARTRGVPLSSLDMTTGSFAMLSTWSLGKSSAAISALQFVTSIIFTTWLGAAIIPRLGQVPWLQFNSPVTTMDDVATSLQTGNCYSAADASGLNLGSCGGNWMVGAVASLSFGPLYVQGNTYDSGCTPAYTQCAQRFIAGVSPLQDPLKNLLSSSASALLPTYQVNLNCQLNQVELYGLDSINRSIWITYTNSSFNLNILGPDALNIPRSVVAQCVVSLNSGMLEWEEYLNTATGTSGSLPDQADPSILLQQFASLISWANATNIGFSWSPLLSVLMSGHDDDDLAPLAQILNGLLAELLNRAYVDSVLHGSTQSLIRVTRPGIHFASGVARWLCIVGAAVVAISTAVMMVVVYRNPAQAMMTKPSSLILAPTVRRDENQQIMLSGDPITKSLVAKWRARKEDASSICIVIDEKGKEDEYPKLQTGVCYGARFG